MRKRKPEPDADSIHHASLRLQQLDRAIEALSNKERLDEDDRLAFITLKAEWHALIDTPAFLATQECTCGHELDDHDHVLNHNERRCRRCAPETAPGCVLIVRPA